MSKNNWIYHIIDGFPQAHDLASMAAADMDGDGNIEVITGGNHGLLWHRPATGEKGIIRGDAYGVGSALFDIDGDGKLEVITGETRPVYRLVWFKPENSLHGFWERNVLSEEIGGQAHDITFADVDNDGKAELVTNNVNDPAGIQIYKPGPDVRKPWEKFDAAVNLYAEGLDTGDTAGDGKLDIIHGPYLLSQPAGGCFSGPWNHHLLSDQLREMCRCKFADITGNGRPDIVLVESEYDDGILVWFENTGTEWKKHFIAEDLVYAHSLDVRTRDGEAKIYIAEMARGGYGAPLNRNARVIEYTSSDGGKTWETLIMDGHNGTHEAFLIDIDNDGEEEFAGKRWGKHDRWPALHYWKKEPRSPSFDFTHRFVDLRRPAKCTNLFTMDMNGDGLEDAVCGRWWYRNGDWKRFDIPYADQVLFAHDVDGDGELELFATELSESPDNSFCWLKPVNPEQGKWEKHRVAASVGDWPHGAAAADFGTGKTALAAAYHSGQNYDHFPELFEMQDESGDVWKRRPLVNIRYGEQLIPVDLNGDGDMDLLAGNMWFKNTGNGSFEPRFITDTFKAARCAAADLTGNGKLDVVIGEEVLDGVNRVVPFSRLAWFENPGEPEIQPWRMHVIEMVRCPHSLDTADIDGDGVPEIICGEHDPYRPGRTGCRLMIFKRADELGKIWKCYVLDRRFDHHVGAKVFDIKPGEKAILSQGWNEYQYLHLWTRKK